MEPPLLRRFSLEQIIVKLSRTELKLAQEKSVLSRLVNKKAEMHF